MSAPVGAVLILMMFGSGILLARSWLARNRSGPVVHCACTPRLSGKVVVITGATTGIGYEVTFALAKQGACLILGCRNIRKGNDVANKIKNVTNNENISVIHLELESLQSCKTFAKEVLSRKSAISFLINNAAVFNVPTTKTVDGFERTWQTNFLGAVVITEHLKEDIGEDIGGNKGIIFLSSESVDMVKSEDIMDTEQFTYVPNIVAFEDRIKHYARTKHALWMYATYLAYCQGKHPAYTVVSVDPGNTWTQIYRHSFWGSLSDLFTRWQCSVFMRSPLEGAQTVLHCLNALKISNGRCLKDCSVVRKPSRDTVERCPSFVANTHRKLAAYIPDQIFSPKR